MTSRWVKVTASCAVILATSHAQALGDTQELLPRIPLEGSDSAELERVWAAQFEPTGDRGFGKPPVPDEGLTDVLPDPQPAPSPEPVIEEPSAALEPSGPDTLTISGHVDCTGAPQPCIDAGNLTYYSGCWKNGECSQLIGGHDYMGFEYLNSVPTGTIVSVPTGPGAGTYVVYDHMYIDRQGGDMPSFGGAALVLQSCSGAGTGFSLLRKA